MIRKMPRLLKTTIDIPLKPEPPNIKHDFHPEPPNINIPFTPEPPNIELQEDVENRMMREHEKRKHRDDLEPLM